MSRKKNQKTVTLSKESIQIVQQQAAEQKRSFSDALDLLILKQTNEKSNI